MYSWWSHVWAVPCNNKVECDNGYDEENCHIPNWILPTILICTFVTLFITKFLYLQKNLNRGIQNILKANLEPPPNKFNQGQSSRHWNTALMLEENRFDEVKEFYMKEIEFHGSEPNTFCCLKVIILNM